MREQKLYWIGPRESDADGTGEMFCGTVTLYGSNAGTNVSGCAGIGKRTNHNLFDEALNRFMIAAERELCSDPDVRFMMYNPEILQDLPADIASRVICINDPALTERIGSKLRFRQFAEPYVRVPPYLAAPGAVLDFDDLSRRLNADTLVIQPLFSSGGVATYRCTKESFARQRKKFRENETYLVSAYIAKAVPLNMHAVCGADCVRLFPGSVQIILPDDQGRMTYRGGDYVTYQTIPAPLRAAFAEGTLRLGEALRQAGYRGVFGADALLSGETVYFNEINPRFQASSRLLNLALERSGLPSLQRMHAAAFAGEPLPAGTEDIEIGDSFFTYCLSATATKHARLVLNRAKRLGYTLTRNGFGSEPAFSPDCYMFEISAHRNFTEIKPSGEVCILPNLPEPSVDWMETIRAGSPILTKTALMNRGVRLSGAFAEKAKTLRKGVNFSLDIELPGFIVNCPVNIPVTDFTPFEIGISEEADGKPGLYCYDRFLCGVSFYESETLPLTVTSGGVEVSGICLASTDRLRIRHTRNCCYGRAGRECKFCGDALFFDWNKPDYTETDIREATRCFFEACSFRHILIGGPSDLPERETAKITAILEDLRRYPKKPVYVMCLPPENLSVLEAYRRAGVTEIAFNLELFDREIAARVMPNKGRLPLARYENALKEAVRLWGATGNVRTSFVAGLEPEESLLRGIEWCCSLGAAPIISPFRPVPGTPMEYGVPFPDEKLCDIYEKAVAVCAKYGLSPGPACDACKNNTLAL